MSTRDWHKKTARLHERLTNRITTQAIERFLGEQGGLKFVSGETEKNGPVIYAIHREKPIDPLVLRSPTPDLAVLYFNGQWNLSFIECKATVGAATLENLWDQEERTMEYIIDRRIIRRFLENLKDRHLTSRVVDQICQAGAGYYGTRVTSNGELKSLLSSACAL